MKGSTGVAILFIAGAVWVGTVVTHAFTFRGLLDAISKVEGRDFLAEQKELDSHLPSHTRIPTVALVSVWRQFLKSGAYPEESIAAWRSGMALAIINSVTQIADGGPQSFGHALLAASALVGSCAMAWFFGRSRIMRRNEVGMRPENSGLLWLASTYVVLSAAFVSASIILG